MGRQAPPALPRMTLDGSGFPVIFGGKTRNHYNLGIEEYINLFCAPAGKWVALLIIRIFLHKKEENIIHCVL